MQPMKAEVICAQHLLQYQIYGCLARSCANWPMAERNVEEDDDALNSVLDGDDEGWYTESNPILEGTSPLQCLRPDDSTITLTDSFALAVGEKIEERGDGDSSDGGVDGVSVRARRKRAARRQLEREQLEVTKAKLTRDWDTKVANWYKLTKDEINVFGLDVSALMKMRDYRGVRTNRRRTGHGRVPAATVFLLDAAKIIESESKKYYNQHLNERVDRWHTKKVSQDPKTTRETVLLQESKRHKKIKAEESWHNIGLLVARKVCPHKRRFADQWAKTTVDAVPKGTFGRFMSKTRLKCKMQNLHFTDNTDARVEPGRAWKVRSVVDKL
ncbi:hypothetical protein PHMEG_0006165 [Phytophthora megakarya]|uniref:PiggyBac transposable element-derived protein domain-containing protein n=1 Tax=Phytophthora megakarya TaxID=4795 RepID=A0A225WPK6_9STRA|nr:hypothetical protein PHMEG_0006165 [Phytophthora megakarya]